MKQTTRKFKCRHCSCQEIIRDGEFKKKAADIKAVYCPGPMCGAKNKRRKMIEVEIEDV